MLAPPTSSSLFVVVLVVATLAAPPDALRPTPPTPLGPGDVRVRRRLALARHRTQRNPSAMPRMSSPSQFRTETRVPRGS